MNTYLNVTVWDSVTGETSMHEIHTDRLLTIHNTNELAQVAHMLVCKETGEDPASWGAIGAAKTTVLDLYSGPDTISTMYVNTDFSAVSVEIVTYHNYEGTLIDNESAL